MPARSRAAPKPEKNKSLDQWVWGTHLRRAQHARRVRQRRKLPNQSSIRDAAGSIRGAKDAPKYKNYSRYIHTSDAEEYRPLAEIVAELEALEAEARETDKALRKILKQLGV